MTQTATLATTDIPSPTSTLPSTATASPFPAPTTTAIPAVATNESWHPQFKPFNGVEMALVPPGCFWMGISQAGGKQCFDKPFWIDKYDMTNAQFIRLNGTARRASYWPGNDQPRDSITWIEAKDFCIKERGARLPTEAEWEYAARGPDNLAYPWGNNWNANNTVFAGNSGGQTANVGSRPDNASWVGALDMNGNVWQWVNSLYAPYPYEKDDGRENTGDITNKRVLRGGAWDTTETSLLTTTFRYYNDPSVPSNNYGFRCVRDW